MEKEIDLAEEPFVPGVLFDEEVSQRLFCRQGHDVVLEAACVDENGRRKCLEVFQHASVTDNTFRHGRRGPQRREIHHRIHQGREQSQTHSIFA